MTRCGGVQLGEHALLDIHPLGYGLDDEVDVSEALVGGRAVDPAEDLLDLGVGLLGGDPAFLGQLADLTHGDVPGLRQTCLDERLVDVLEHHGDARCGDRLGDLSTHRPGAHDGGSEHEHACLLLLIGDAERSDAAGVIGVRLRRGS